MTSSASVAQRFLQTQTASVDARLNRADWTVDNLCNLFIGQAVEVAQ